MKRIFKRGGLMNMPLLEDEIVAIINNNLASKGLRIKPLEMPAEPSSGLAKLVQIARGLLPQRPYYAIVPVTQTPGHNTFPHLQVGGATYYSSKIGFDSGGVRLPRHPDGESTRVSYADFKDALETLPVYQEAQLPRR